ncbi:MAG: DEAD/DEAH box helicase family protein [Chloroflexi bacterium]|nr:DEAD/DEAH box helicase family protein [Chloroflexota bacterium]
MTDDLRARHHTSAAELRREIEQLRAENARLRALLAARPEAVGGQSVSPIPTAMTLFGEDEPLLPKVDARSSAEEKIALFRALFAGRHDVYAAHWDNPRTGKAGWSPAVVGGPANARRPDRAYLPLTDAVFEAHLSGRVHVGLYPLLADDACRLLASDFDGRSWQLDARAYQDAARAMGVEASVERSRSGDGAHVWIFFTEAVPASVARRIGVHLLREAMTVRAELDLASYDRLFPAQDFVPKGSFGNLIALPLQGQSRRKGTTVFLDDSLEPFEDQWAFLSSVRRVSAAAAHAMAEQLREVAAGPMEPTYRRPFRSDGPKPAASVEAVAGTMLAIDRIGLPPALVSALKHLASLHNPEYYEKERLRFSTWNTPRLIRCYEETVDQLLLPRGLREPAAALVEQAGSHLEVQVRATDAPAISVQFGSSLEAEQQTALDHLRGHDLGVLVAPPGAGKTVIACAALAERAVATLVLVDRQPLLDQWRERLQEHLGLGRRQIGTLGGGSGRLKGTVDIAMVQSLARREDVRELTSRYGLVIVDECHHVPAVTFERVVRQIGASSWLGLTATPYRRDGLEGLITMYCGPVRHRMGTGLAEGMPAVERALTVHETAHLGSGDGAEVATPAIQAVFRELVDDGARTRQVCADIAAASRAGRNCLVLSQWKEHVRLIETDLEAFGIEPAVLVGDVGRKGRRSIIARLAEARVGAGVVLIATGSLLGEGFDCPPLDTLFVAFPIAFRGRIVQYVGRVLRPMDGKDRIEVHDYVDVNVPVLARMLTKRLAAYATLGFDIRGVTSRRR